MALARRLQIAARVLTRHFRRSPERIAKQQLVKRYAALVNLRVLIETGTYVGDMIAATRSCFRDVYSVELDRDLYRWARWRFRRSPSIHLYQGDSATVLPQILASITEPCLFWLDAHYSGGITAEGETSTPILRELHSILSHGAGHVILIDDAACFTGSGGYPTVETIRQVASGRMVVNASGVIRITPTGIDECQ